MTSTDTTTTWLRRFKPTATATTRLVCFPHAGGAATFFHPMATRFAPEVDVISLQYPGRQDRRHERCVEDIGLLADLLTAELAGQPDLPTVFFGHSMGAVLAFEVTWRLEHAGAAAAPATVIASGRRAPATIRDERVHRRDDDGIVAELIELNGTDAAVLADEEILRMSMPAIRGDYTAIETYRCPPDRRVRAGITVLTGDADPKTSLDEAQAWDRHTTGPFRLRVVPGGHFFLASQQKTVTAEVAAELETCDLPIVY